VVAPEREDLVKLRAQLRADLKSPWEIEEQLDRVLHG